MMEAPLIIGMDFKQDITQMVCFDENLEELNSISYTNQEQDFMIPSVIGYHPGTKEWVVAKEAMELHKQGIIPAIYSVYDLIREKKEMSEGNKTVSVTRLLECYFRKLLNVVKREYPYATIQMLVITIPFVNDGMVVPIYQALERLGLKKDRVEIMSHPQCFMRYALSQKKELWMNDVSLFSLDEDGLIYYQMTLNRKYMPIEACVKKQEFSNTLGYDLVEEQGFGENLEYIFETIAKNALNKQIISTLYVTGKGFEGNWADDVLKRLCMGRRVFKGQNLFVKGAAYAARDRIYRNLNGFVFRGEELVSYALSLQVYTDAKERTVALNWVGEAWYQLESSFELILDEEQKITFSIRDYKDNEVKHLVFELDGLPKRPRKMTCVSVRVHFEQATSCIITIKDLGFGTFYPSSNRIWEKMISL